MTEPALKKVGGVDIVIVPAKIVEVVRILNYVQAEAAKNPDPKISGLAARASMLSYEIQQHFTKRGS